MTASAQALSRANAVFSHAAEFADLQAAVHRAAHAAVQTGDIPGVVAQVWRKGELCCDVAAGMRDWDRAIPMTPDTIFGIASMTKPVTVALALTLVDEGKLRLDDPIANWVPEFANMRVLRRPDALLDDTVPAQRPITVMDLMTHRAGLTYGFMTAPPLGPALLARVGFGVASALTPAAWLASLAELPLMFQPGERFSYGHSIDVLGFVAARAAGTDLGSAMRERLFAPLGMVDSGFWVPPHKRLRLAPSCVSTQPGQFTASTFGGFTTDKPSAFASGGQGLLSTAADYLRFARMLLQEGSLDKVRVLQPHTVRLMRSNHFTDAQRALPFVAGAPFTQGFGLGMSVIIDASQPGIVLGSEGTFGWPGAFGGQWQADPVEGTILIWLQQCTPAPPQPGDPMPRLPGAQSARRFRTAVYDIIKGEGYAQLAG
jgi:CubicO group peptidase (beta-lactamase class C family)